MEKNNKKALLLSIVAVIALVLLAVGGTFAYFVAQGGTTSSAGVDVLTHTTDSLLFSTGDAIKFTANQTNFAEGGTNVFGESFAKASLIANNKTNTATYNYYVYLEITNNEFKYTTQEKTGELILSVTDPTGAEVKSIPGLNYVTVKGVSGFDITEAKDLVTIVNNHAITASPKKDETWNIKITLANLDSDQTANAGKSFDAKIMIQKEARTTTLADHIKGLYTSQGEKGLYYHDSTLENGANDNSYRYAGANPNNYVCFGTDVSPCPVDNQYRIIGVFGDQVKVIKSDYAKVAQLGTDGNYYDDGQSSVDSGFYYKGSQSLSNIGIYYWNFPTSSAYWNQSELNTINLNVNFLNKFDAATQNKIATTTWKVGGNTWANVAGTTVSNAFKNEITITAESTTYNAKIGLMYVSDYGFAADPSVWTTTLNSYNGNSIPSKNWMYMGLTEWTITRISDIKDIGDDVQNSFDVREEGRVTYDAGHMDSHCVRPVFYLNSNVTYVNGTGTQEDPIIIN